MHESASACRRVTMRCSRTRKQGKLTLADHVHKCRKDDFSLEAFCPGCHQRLPVHYKRSHKAGRVHVLPLGASTNLPSHPHNSFPWASPTHPPSPLVSTGGFLADRQMRWWKTREGQS